MTLYRISVINQHFSASEELDLPSIDHARKQAIKGALQIGIAEISDTKPFFGAEAKVGNGEDCLARFIVSIGVSPLQ